jgi:hypothetical protein
VRGPTTVPASHDDDAEVSGQPVTRERWLAWHVARAPKITPKQWADMLLLLESQDDADEQAKKAG